MLSHIPETNNSLSTRVPVDEGEEELRVEELSVDCPRRRSSSVSFEASSLLVLGELSGIINKGEKHGAGEPGAAAGNNDRSTALSSFRRASDISLESVLEDSSIQVVQKFEAHAID